MVFGIVSCAPPEYEEFGFTNKLDFKTAKDLGFINASETTQKCLPYFASNFFIH